MGLVTFSLQLAISNLFAVQEGLGSGLRLAAVISRFYIAANVPKVFCIAFLL